MSIHVVHRLLIRPIAIRVHVGTNRQAGTVFLVPKVIDTAANGLGHEAFDYLIVLGKKVVQFSRKTAPGVPPQKRDRSCRLFGGFDVESCIADRQGISRRNAAKLFQ